MAEQGTEPLHLHFKGRWLWCPRACCAPSIPAGSPRTSGKLRASSARDFSCHYPARYFPAEFKLLYRYAVRQPFPNRAILLQGENGGNGWCPFLWAAQRCRRTCLLLCKCRLKISCLVPFPFSRQSFVCACVCLHESLCYCLRAHKGLSCINVVR